MEKYKSMLSLNTKIYMQTPRFAFWNEYLTNFLLANIPSTYKKIINNVNIRNILMLKETICTLYIKKTKLTNLGVIKEENMHFAA